MLSEEEAAEIKRQLFEHIEKSFPADKKEFAKSRVDSMDSEHLETFLAENNLVAGQKKGNECIFCSIIFGEIPSYKIGENSAALAVLEINPISKGHVLIIPKAHIGKEKAIPEEAKKLAKVLEKRLSSALKPKRVETYMTNLFGHEVINLLPVYANETSESKRLPAKKDELEEVEKLLTQGKNKEKIVKPTAKKKSSVKKKQQSESPKNIWLPQRIP